MRWWLCVVALAACGSDGAGAAADGASGEDLAVALPTDGSVVDLSDGAMANAPSCDAGAGGAGARLIVVESRCPGQTIVVGVNGGYVQDCGAGGSCPAGTTCLTSRSPPGCFWSFPRPACGSPVLHTGESVTWLLDTPPIAAIKWSGNLYAATQCASDGTGCKTAMCAISTAGTTVVQPCADGIGPDGPTTLAEFTLSSTGVDFYDVSMINGVNVPVAMAPMGGAADPANPYTCATAGACAWQFDPHVLLGGASTDESTLLRAVAAGGIACNSDGDCAAGQKCGSAVDFTTSTLSKRCGAPVGWWTADELCIYTGNALGAPVNCSAAVAGQGTVANLYGCNGANAGSCYQPGANASCCGCPMWSFGGQSVPVAPGFQCDGTNAQWTSSAQPWAAFVKSACPSAYSFPFDDATSTFTCSTASPSAANPNAMGYRITFCPGGLDGS
jgi:hypothetical protein